MYLTATLSIDPSQLTKIERVKPTRAFDRLFYYLSAGLTGDKREIETFTAVSILEQLDTALRSVGIDNVIRLAQDGHDIYLDTEGRKEDLEDAIQAFIEEAPSGSQDDAEPFGSLQLVLEHEDDLLKYLIDVRIRRLHRVGEHPISMRINGVIRQFQAPAGADAEQIKRQMSAVFTSQAAYDDFVTHKQKHFDRFTESLEQAISRTIHCDEVHRQTGASIIRPRRKATRREDVEYDHQDPDVEPLHGGYPGFSDFFFYSWIWSELSHDSGVMLSEVTVVDESGHSMFDVGVRGVDAGMGGAFDPDASFEAPSGGDVLYHDGHSYESELSAAERVRSDSSADLDHTDPGDSGWLSSVFSRDDESFADAASCDRSTGTRSSGSGGSD